MSTSWSERRADELYVYVRGRLVMKRWLKTGVSVVFHVAPRGTVWTQGNRVWSNP